MIHSRINLYLLFKFNRIVNARNYIEFESYTVNVKKMKLFQDILEKITKRIKRPTKEAHDT
jgi:hypothetical protein